MARESPAKDAVGLVRTRKLDPSLDADVAAYAGVLAVVEKHMNPGLPTTPASFYAPMLRHTRRHLPKDFFVTEAADGRPIAAGAVGWWGEELTENQHRLDTELDYRWDVDEAVAVDALRTSVRYAAEAGAELGKTLFAVEGRDDPVVRRAYGELGLKLAESDYRSVLDLTSIDRDAYQKWASNVPDGYELVYWRNHCPDDLLESYVAAIGAMNDAPRGEMDFEDMTFTPERTRESERVVRAREHEFLVAAAVESATRTVAAFTELIVPPLRVWHVDQEDTAVVPAHRGRGLGRLVKTANILALLDAFPEAQMVETWNSVTNEHMLRVNVEIGFQRRETWTEWEAPLASLL